MCVRNWMRGAAPPRPATSRRASVALLPAAIDEILRIHALLLANRRVATHAGRIRRPPGGAGERITLIWASANRDEAVFGDPDELRLDRDPTLNLLHGAGIHVCPGAPLQATYPASGFASLPLRLSPRPA
jgi:hypothetical protein